MFNVLVKNFIQTLFPAYGMSYQLLPYYQPRQAAPNIYLLTYSEVPVRESIRTNKYHRSQSASTALAAVLNQYITRFEHSKTTIIPIPQSHTRWRERGFNHLDEILNKSSCSKNVRTNILKKSIHTKRQAHVARTERLTQQVNTFSCHQARAQELRGVVILFDDVLTTGSTMRAARIELAKHLHPETTLICLALAH